MRSIAAIEKRLKALEQYQEDKPSRTIVVFQNEDGTVRHDGDIYQTLDAAKVDNPGYDLWVIIICEDMSAK